MIAEACRTTGRVVVAAAAAAMLWFAGATGALAQGTAQLEPLAKSYTLGRFTYQGPDADGWRQRAEVAEQLEARAQARKTVLLAGPAAELIGSRLGRPPVMVVGVVDRALARGLAEAAAGSVHTEA